MHFIKNKHRSANGVILYRPSIRVWDQIETDMRQNHPGSAYNDIRSLLIFRPMTVSNMTWVRDILIAVEQRRQRVERWPEGSTDIENNVCTLVTNCFSLHESVILVFILINTRITFDWAQKQFVTREHTLFHFLQDITNPQMTIQTTLFTHRARVSLARFSFCWWRHNGLLMTSQWPNNCDAITWIVISNSLDIDFIHGDIHGRSCKKLGFMVLARQW